MRALGNRATHPREDASMFEGLERVENNPESRPEAARGLYERAWEESGDDFEPCIGVHYLDHQQPSAEDRIRCAKDTGLTNLPLHSFAQKQIWCALVALYFGDRLYEFLSRRLS